MSADTPIPRSERQATLVATAGQTVFGPFDWIIWDTADIVVFQRNAGAESFVKVLSGYTVAAVDELPGNFTVTFAAGRAAGDAVQISGARVHERLTNVTQGGVVRAAPLEAEFDRITAVLQEIRRDLAPDQVPADLVLGIDMQAWHQNLQQLSQQAGLTINKLANGITSLIDYESDDDVDRRVLDVTVTRTANTTKNAQLVRMIETFEEGALIARMLDYTHTTKKGAISTTSPWLESRVQEIGAMLADITGQHVVDHIQSQSLPGSDAGVWCSNWAARNVDPSPSNDDPPVNINDFVSGMQIAEWNPVRASAWNKHKASGQDDTEEADTINMIQVGPRGGGECREVLKASIRNNARAFSATLASDAGDVAGTTLKLPDEPGYSRVDANYFTKNKHWFHFHKEPLSPTIPKGTSVIANGGFDTPDGWTAPAGASISGGKLNCTGFTGSVSRTAINDPVLFGASGESLFLGNLYLVTFATESVTGGSAALRVGGGTAGTARTTSGSWSQWVYAGSSQDIEVVCANFTGKVDNVAITFSGQPVYKITAFNPATRIITFEPPLRIDPNDKKINIHATYTASQIAYAWRTEYGTMNYWYGADIKSETGHGEKVPDPYFEDPDAWDVSGLSAGTAAVAGSKMTFAGPATGTVHCEAVNYTGKSLDITTGITPGDTYRTILRLANVTAGSLKLGIGNLGTLGTARAAAGTFIETLTAAGSLNPNDAPANINQLRLVAAGFAGDVTLFGCLPTYPNAGQGYVVDTDARYNEAPFDFSKAYFVTGGDGVTPMLRVPKQPHGEDAVFDIFRPVDQAWTLGLGAKKKSGTVAQLDFFGYDTANARAAYGEIETQVVSNIAGATEGVMRFKVPNGAGTMAVQVDVRKDELRPRGSGAVAQGNVANRWSDIYAERVRAGIVLDVNTQTDSYTLVLADLRAAIELDKATANTLTVPPNAAVAFPIGSLLTVAQYGAGQTTLTPGAGVTIRSRVGLKLAGQYAVASLYKRGTDEWVAGGDLTT